MSIESKELEEFIRISCQSIQNGITEGLMLNGNIDFEIAVATDKTANGSFKLLVIGASVNYKKEELSKIKFSICEKPLPPMIVSSKQSR